MTFQVFYDLCAPCGRWREAKRKRAGGLSLKSHCCGTSEASEQQHNQDLREKYIGYEKSRFDRFLPEFTAPRTHLEPEFTAPRTIASLSFKPRFHFILRK